LLPNQVFMTLYESITSKSKLEGKLEGILEGKIEGKIEGKLEVLLNGYDNGLTISILANITGFSEDQVISVLKDHKKLK